MNILSFREFAKAIEKETMYLVVLCFVITPLMGFSAVLSAAESGMTTPLFHAYLLIMTFFAGMMTGLFLYSSSSGYALKKQMKKTDAELVKRFFPEAKDAVNTD